MKKYIALGALLLSVFMGHAQHGAEESMEGHHCFFEERTFSMGLGLPYSFHIASPGVNARFYYNMGHNFCFGPEVSYFSLEGLEVLDFDFVAHYIFETPYAGVYPLVGVNYTHEVEFGHALGAAGVVFGAGLHRNFNSFTVFAEYSMVRSELSDYLATVGLMYTL